MSNNFLNTLAGFGTQLKNAAVEGLNNTAQVTVAAASDVLRSAGTQVVAKTISKGTIKQPAKGTDANGATTLVVPAGTTLNSQGQVIAAPVGMDTKKALMIGGGVLAALVVGVIAYKAVT